MKEERRNDGHAGAPGIYRPGEDMMNQKQEKLHCRSSPVSFNGRMRLFFSGISVRVAVESSIPGRLDIQDMVEQRHAFLACEGMNDCLLVSARAAWLRQARCGGTVWRAANNCRDRAFHPTTLPDVAQI